MKIILTLISVLTISYSSFAQTNGIQIKKLKSDLHSNINKNKHFKPKYKLQKTGFATKHPLTQLHYEWNTTGWEFNYDSGIEYFSDGRKKSESWKDEFGNVFAKVNYSYDAQLRLVQIYSEVISLTGWEPFYSTIMEYNVQGDLVKYEDRYWNNNAWVIINGLAYAITYEPTLGTKATVESYFNGSAYDTSMKYIEYRTNNQLISEETHQYVGNQTFIPIEKFDYLFDNTIDTGLLKYMWDGSTWKEDMLYCNYVWSSPSKDFLTNNNVYIKLGSTWFMYEREIYTQESFGGFSYLLQDYGAGTWIDNMRIYNLNDSIGNRVAYIYDLFLNGTWQQLFRIEETYVYDNEENILEHIYKETDSNGDLLPISKDVYSNYSLLLGVNNTQKESIRFYPNPTTDYIVIENNKFQHKAFQITDINGIQILKGEINTEMKITLPNLSPGVYIITIENSQNKFIVGSK